jgi:hypothetical protein
MTFDLNKIKQEDLEFKISSTVDIGKPDSGPRRFSGVGYSGEPITGHPFWGLVAFDLSGMQVPNPMPILLGHDPDKIVGFSQKFSTEGSLKLEGLLSRKTEFGRHVEELSDEGFPWQMSVRIRPLVIEELMQGASGEVNGKTLTGPAVIFRKSKISETSFTPIGWDDKTSATALSLTTIKKEDDMSTELEAKVKQLTEELLASNTQLEVAKTAISSLTSEIATFKEAEVIAAKSLRLSKVKELFTKMKKEPNDEAIIPFMSMDAATFDLVLSNIDEMSRTLTPKDLFSEQAIGDPSKGGVSVPSKLVQDAERRASEFAKRK